MPHYILGNSLRLLHPIFAITICGAVLINLRFKHKNLCIPTDIYPPLLVCSVQKVAMIEIVLVLFLLCHSVRYYI